jgi:ankyrin repeat protein
MSTLFNPDITLEEAKELIKNGADVNEIDLDGYSPIFYVSSLDVAQLFIKHDANVNFKNDYGITPLHVMAQWLYKIEITKLLIMHGADVNAKNKDGWTPIFYVEDSEATELLIKYGAEINIKDYYENTILDRKMLQYPTKKQDSIHHAKFLIDDGAISGKIETYQLFREYFSLEQQKAFDAFASITSNNNDFYQMCLAYQEGMKNNPCLEIKDIDIL